MRGLDASSDRSADLLRGEVGTKKTVRLWETAADLATQAHPARDQLRQRFDLDQLHATHRRTIFGAILSNFLEPLYKIQFHQEATILREIFLPSLPHSTRERGTARSRSLSCSIGVACFPMHASTPAELIEAADQALYTAKAAGKNCLREYNLEMNASTEAFPEKPRRISPRNPDSSLVFRQQNPRRLTNDGSRMTEGASAMLLSEREMACYDHR